MFRLLGCPAEQQSACTLHKAVPARRTPSNSAVTCRASCLLRLLPLPCTSACPPTLFTSLADTARRRRGIEGALSAAIAKLDSEHPTLVHQLWQRLALHAPVKGGPTAPSAVGVPASSNSRRSARRAAYS